MAPKSATPTLLEKKCQCAALQQKASAAEEFANDLRTELINVRGELEATKVALAGSPLTVLEVLGSSCLVSREPVLRFGRTVVRGGALIADRHSVASPWLPLRAVKLAAAEAALAQERRDADQWRLMANNLSTTLSARSEAHQTGRGCGGQGASGILGVPGLEGASHIPHSIRLKACPRPHIAERRAAEKAAEKAARKQGGPPGELG